MPGMATATNPTAPQPAPAIGAGDAQRKLDIEFGGYTTAGTKPRNEDAFAAHQPKGAALQLKGVAGCIADGASCSENAQLASETSVTHFISDYYSTPDTWPVKTAAARVLSALNSWLYHHGKQSVLPHNGLVTTFSAVIIKSTSAHIFHSGDSRIYRYRAGELQLLTRDHVHAQRHGENFLTRALGIDSHLEMDYEIEEVEIGDILLLSTDGVHGVLNNAELIEQLTALEDRPEQCARALVDMALRKGSTDNLSCLLLRVRDLPHADIDEVHRQLTQLAIPPVLEVGQSIDGFRVQRILHSGTRSHLYIVTSNIENTLDDDKKWYVLKAPSENFAEDAQYLEGFMREQWVASRINHSGIMKIVARPANSPFLYLLCEYIEGKTLRQWLFDNPKPSLESVRTITRDLISALRALQRMHMTHRDLKPENIMVTTAGEIKIIDFGTVHVGGLEEVQSPLGEGPPVGSADYIAPEYLLGDSGAFHSDIFSLGVIVYEMLTGHVPYKLSQAQQRHLKGLHEYRYTSARQYRSDLPLWIDLALEKSTQPNVRLRYHVLSEMLRDLCEPNVDMLRAHQHAPLLQRNPIRFWQSTTLILLVIVVVQCYFLVNRHG
jgi:protein phosphatase